MRLAHTLALCALLIPCVSHAIKATSTPTPGANIAVAYTLPNDSNVYGQNLDTFYHPASTQKVITALAAMLYLGPDFTLTTRLEIENRGIKNNALNLDPEGTLHADVRIVFTGDPTLSADEYRKLLNVLKTQGVKRIDGRILLDISRFGGRSRGSGWSWDDLPVCFTAPSAPIVINRNCAFASLKNTGVGRLAQPLPSASDPISITSDVVTVNPRDYGGSCELEAQLFIDNRYHLTGCVPATPKGKPWPLSLAVADPVRWGIDWTGKILRSLKLEHQGILAVQRPSSDFTAISQIRSPNMRAMVKYMLQHSNNLYADTIAKNIAAEYYRMPATYYRAAQAMRSILSQYADIDLGDAYLVDGSGLSPHNLISPRILLNIMQYILRHDDKLGLIALLPVSGESGTLHWRASTSNAPLAHNVTAKTGTLQNVMNLAGFVKTASGVRVPFVIFANSITFNQKTRDLVKYRRIASPHLGYERYLLEQIYQGKVMGRDF